MSQQTETRKTEVREGTYAQIGDMGWREKIDGVWTDTGFDPDFVLYDSDAARYDACAVAGFGLYVDFSRIGRLELARVYRNREFAERALTAFARTGMVP